MPPPRPYDSAAVRVESYLREFLASPPNAGNPQLDPAAIAQNAAWNASGHHNATTPRTTNAAYMLTLAIAKEAVAQVFAARNPSAPSVMWDFLTFEKGAQRWDEMRQTLELLVQLYLEGLIGFLESHLHSARALGGRGYAGGFLDGLDAFLRAIRQATPGQLAKQACSNIAMHGHLPPRQLYLDSLAEVKDLLGDLAVGATNPTLAQLGAVQALGWCLAFETAAIANAGPLRDQTITKLLASQLNQKLFGWLCRQLCDPDTAADLVNWTFAKLWCSCGYDPLRPLDPYVFQIARNELRNYIRANPVQCALPAGLQGPPLSSGLSPLSLQLRDLTRDLLKELWSLGKDDPPLCRVAIMRFVKTKLCDIAAIEGIGTTTASDRAKRACDRLEKALTAPAYGYTSAECGALFRFLKKAGFRGLWAAIWSRSPAPSQPYNGQPSRTQKQDVLDGMVTSNSSGNKFLALFSLSSGADDVEIASMTGATVAVVQGNAQDGRSQTCGFLKTRRGWHHTRAYGATQHVLNAGLESYLKA